MKECSDILQSKNYSVNDKYDAIYQLRSMETEEAMQTLRDCYPFLEGSELLQHEVMYVFGQVIIESNIDFLIATLHNDLEAPVVRHEAGEALANYPLQRERSLPELRKYLDSNISVLRSTVNLAIKKLESYNFNSNNYCKYVTTTAEPAEPFTEEEMKNMLVSVGLDETSILDFLLNEKHEEYLKYQVIYRLRNRESVESIIILSQLLLPENMNKTSPLMRHEIGFIFGQLSSKAEKNVDAKMNLQKCLLNLEEDPIVRHEIILAYSEIWGVDDVIKGLKNDKSLLVSESAAIVMD